MNWSYETNVCITLYCKQYFGPHASPEWALQCYWREALASPQGSKNTFLLASVGYLLSNGGPQTYASCLLAKVWGDFWSQVQARKGGIGSWCTQLPLRFWSPAMPHPQSSLLLIYQQQQGDEGHSASCWHPCSTSIHLPRWPWPIEQQSGFPDNSPRT